MTPLYALEILKDRITTLSLNHKIGSRDIAKQEVKEIVMSIELHVIPTLEKALERAKKVEEELEEYKISDKSKEESSIEYYNLYKEIKCKLKELKRQLPNLLKTAIQCGYGVEHADDIELQEQQIVNELLSRVGKE